LQDFPLDSDCLKSDITRIAGRSSDIIAPPAGQLLSFALNN